MVMKMGFFAACTGHDTTCLSVITECNRGEYASFYLWNLSMDSIEWLKFWLSKIDLASFVWDKWGFIVVAFSTE